MSSHSEKSESVEEEKKELSVSEGADENSEVVKQCIPKGLPDQFKSDDPNCQLSATVKIRQLLSEEIIMKGLIDEIVDAGLLPILVSFLSRQECPQLQFEACWAISNICSGSETQTNLVIKTGAVPVLLKLLSNNNEQVREQAVWALGNIAGDGPSIRDYVLKCNILPPLFKIIEERPNIQTLRTSVWCLSNLVRGKPFVDWKVVVKVIPLLGYLVHNSDHEVLKDVLGSISYISEAKDNRIQAIVESNIVRRLVDLLSHDIMEIQYTALKTISRITGGSSVQTQAVISLGALPHLSRLLKSHKILIRKEALRAISSICAGSQSQLQSVFDCDKLFESVIETIFDDGCLIKESMICLSISFLGANSTQIQRLVDLGAIKSTFDALKHTTFGDHDHHEVVLVVLDGISALLEIGKKLGEALNEDVENLYTGLVKDCGGIETLKKLQDYKKTKNHEVIKKATKILSRYYNFEVDMKERVVFLLESTSIKGEDKEKTTQSLDHTFTIRLQNREIKVFLKYVFMYPYVQKIDGETLF